MTSVGLALRNFTGPGDIPDPSALIEYAERAEALGFESVWVWDHLLLGVNPVYPILESLSMLSAIAVRTSRIGLGTGVLALPLRNPVVAAKVLTTVDHLSGGRLILGVAAGWYAREFDAVGVAHSKRGRILDRNLELIIRLWTERSVDYQDDELHLRSAVMLPLPLQQPRPKILIGGYVDAVLRRVARLGDGWLTYFYTPESVARSIRAIDLYATELGRDPASISVTNQVAVYVGRDHSSIRDGMQSWLREDWDLSKGSESTFDHAVTGTAVECAEQLQAHFDAGVDRLVLIPYRYQKDQVEAIAGGILPILTDQDRAKGA